MKRDFDIAEHHRRIAERDQQIYDIYNSPKQITHTKLEMHKTQHVNELNQAMGDKDFAKTTMYASDKMKRKAALLADMVK